MEATPIIIMKRRFPLVCFFQKRISFLLSPKTVTDLMNLMASVLDELRNEMCAEIVGMSYKEVFAEVQKSPASVYAKALEYTWRCYLPSKLTDLLAKYAEPSTFFRDSPFRPAFHGG